VERLRQHVEAVRDGQVTQTNDLSIELARLNEQEGFVTNLFGKVRGRYPDLPIGKEPPKPTEQEQPHSPPLDRRTGHHRKRLKVDPKVRVASWGETELAINKETEFIVLKTLYNAQSEVVAYGKLLGAVKPDTYGSFTTTEAPPEIKPAISRIRKAFKQVGCPYEIQVIKGLGYRLIRWKNSKINVDQR
jgi:DNA-binding response OmpR family regulator